MTKFIAEIGSNHNQNIIRTLQLIEEAKQIGAWGVKFQLFKAEKLYAPEFKAQIQKMKKWELPEYFIDHILYECRKQDLKFICTPFDLEAVDFLNKYVDIFKIGSYELLFIHFIKAVINTGKPWIISAGMEEFHLNIPNRKLGSFMPNIREAIRIGKELNNPPCAVLACNSNYPAKAENCNLRNINILKNHFYCYYSPIGWSDHTVEPGIIYKAISLGAEIIEFHFDLEDGKGFESDVGHCWKPSQIKKVIHDIEIGEIAEHLNDPNETEAKKWRTDPVDGMRPLQKYRKELLNNDGK